MIGTLRTVVLDCRQPTELAEFYRAVLGGDVHTEEPDFVVLDAPRGRRLAFQLSPEHAPPEFPDPAGSQQFHLDIQVDDVDAAEREVIALGAARVGGAGEEGDQGDDNFRVYRDPAGHTFCLVWGVPYLES